MLQLKFNEYGNIAAYDVPADATQFPRLTPSIKKMLEDNNVAYGRIFLGFKGSKGRWKPELGDWVCMLTDLQKQELLRLTPRAKTPEEIQRSKERAKRQRIKKHRKEIAAFCWAIKGLAKNYDLGFRCKMSVCLQIARRACEVGSGRVGRTSTLELRERALRACRAHYRHNYTNYEQLLELGYDRDDARDMVYKL